MRKKNIGYRVHKYTCLPLSGRDVSGVLVQYVDFNVLNSIMMWEINEYLISFVFWCFMASIEAVFLPVHPVVTILCYKVLNLMIQGPLPEVSFFFFRSLRLD